MKKFKKIMAVLVAAIMVVAMMVPAWADDFEGAAGYTINIKDAIRGEIYAAYKVFDEAHGADSDLKDVYIQVPLSEIKREENKLIDYYIEDGNAPSGYAKITNPASITVGTNVFEKVKKPVAYTIDSVNNPWYPVVNAFRNKTDSGLTLTPIAATPTIMAVDIDKTKFKAADFAADLKKALDSSDSPETGYPNRTTLNNWKAAEKTAPTDATNTANGTNKVDISLKVGKTATEAKHGAGYYFVDTTTGAFCALDSTTKETTVYEKNTVPSLEKKVCDTENGTYGAETNVNIGDDVFFAITVTDGIGTDNTITVHDTMDDGLTLKPNSFTVTASTATAPVAGTDYTIKIKNTTKISEAISSANTHITTDSSIDCSFEVVFTADFVKKLATEGTIVIKYGAILNASAKINDSTASDLSNNNKAKLTYSNQSTPEKSVDVNTFRFRINKVDNADIPNPLTQQNVKFTLTKVISSTTYYYRDSSDSGTAPTTTTANVWNTDSQEKTTDTNGYIVFTGLEAGTYTLTETQTAPGYKPLTYKINVTISDSGVVTAATDESTPTAYTITASSKDASTAVVTPANFNIVNIPGTELPSTGGMGTTVLYIVGGMLVILAGAYLFFSRKKTA